MVSNPLVKLQEKMKNNKCSLEFKKVTQKQLRQHVKKLKKKKSSGLDGLSQENLILGIKHLVAPITSIINQSLQDGEFPQDWKEAVVTPVLKKGNNIILYNITYMHSLSAGQICPKCDRLQFNRF